MGRNIDGTIITVQKAKHDVSAAPLVPLTAAPRFPQPPAQRPTSPARRSSRIVRKQRDEEYRMEINIFGRGDATRPKPYIGVLHTGQKVLAKLWDGWKHPGDEKDREIGVYNALRAELGKIVPRMIVEGG